MKMSINKKERELFTVLETHSERIKEWMSTLNQMMQPSKGFSLPLIGAWLSALRNRLTGTKQDQSVASSSTSSHLDNQYPQITVSIENIKSTIEILEDHILFALTSMEKETTKMTDSNKSESSPYMVQLYDRDGHMTVDLMPIAEQLMPHQIKITPVKNEANIDKNKPLIVLCQTRSRLQPDINYAWEKIQTLLPEAVSSKAEQHVQGNDAPVRKTTEASVPNADISQGVQQLQGPKSSERKQNTDDVGFHAATLVIHSTEESNLPKVPSQLMLSGEKYKKIKIIDVAFTKERKFYKCKMNTDAASEIADFLKESSSTSP